jgi:heme oxygenase
MNLDLLRSATREQHQATEAAMPSFDGSFSREEYATALTGMYRAIACWDSWSEAHVPEDLADLLRERHRGPALASDLHSFHIEPPAPGSSYLMDRAWRTAATAEAQRAAFLGMMYVVEGSTLGGQFIATRTEQVLGLKPGQGDAFFRGYGTQTGERWREFRAVLAEVAEEHTTIVLAAAVDMFRHFQHSLAAAFKPQRSRQRSLPTVA